MNRKEETKKRWTNRTEGTNVDRQEGWKIAGPIGRVEKPLDQQDWVTLDQWERSITKSDKYSASAILHPCRVGRWANRIGQYRTNGNEVDKI